MGIQPYKGLPYLWAARRYLAFLNESEATSFNISTRSYPTMGMYAVVLDIIKRNPGQTDDQICTLGKLDLVPVRHALVDLTQGSTPPVSQVGIETSAVVTISIATPGVVTWAAHGLTVGQAISFSTTGALPTGLVAGTQYYVIAAGFVSGSFQVSAQAGGAAINTSGTQSGVHTAWADALYSAIAGRS
jgi:hypothetical protein